MIDTNEQLKELFAPFEHIDVSKLRSHEITASKERPIYWICEDNGGDLCCGKSTVESQVDLVLSSQVGQIMFFRRGRRGRLEINSILLYLLFSSIAVLLLQFIVTPGLIANMLTTIGSAGIEVSDGKIDNDEMVKRVKKSADTIIHAFRLLTGLSLVKLTVALYILLK